jgi:hypothetical protein
VIDKRVDVEFVKRVDVLVRGIEEQRCKALHHDGTLLIGVAMNTLVSREPRSMLPVIIEVLAMSWCRMLLNSIFNENEATH